MSTKWSLIGGMVLLVCLVAIVPVLAQGPGENPVYATVEYVDQTVGVVYEYIEQQIAAVYAYVDEQVGGGGGVAPPSWEVAAAWQLGYNVYSQKAILQPVGECHLTGFPSTLPANNFKAVGIAHLPDGDFVVTGTCEELWFWWGPDQLEDFPEGEFEVDVWYAWMGETKKATYLVGPFQAPTQ